MKPGTEVPGHPNMPGLSEEEEQPGQQEGLRNGSDRFNHSAGAESDLGVSTVLFLKGTIPTKMSIVVIVGPIAR